MFQNEFMTGTADLSSVYSAITLALFEDSGWYQANYTRAQRLEWGNLMGCAFPQVRPVPRRPRTAGVTRGGCVVRAPAVHTLAVLSAAVPLFAMLLLVVATVIGTVSAAAFLLLGLFRRGLCAVTTLSTHTPFPARACAFHTHTPRARRSGARLPPGVHGISAA